MPVPAPPRTTSGEVGTEYASTTSFGKVKPTLSTLWRRSVNLVFPLLLLTGSFKRKGLTDIGIFAQGAINPPLFHPEFPNA
ncbi:unannotated protein [freshwater metagenome]|uniref:Unannotated protein n=1 Tax=freshwater metagenome TaxID=449393 RepID=A0A6J7Q0A4_9ZZZZ